MEKRKLNLLLAAIAVILIASLLLLSTTPKVDEQTEKDNKVTDKTPGGSEPLDDSQATAEKIDQMVSANNDFAFDFYRQIDASDENLFFSPWSLESALSMTYEGARGQTADEMAEVLYLPKELNIRGPAFASLNNMINAPHENYTLTTANALWAEQTYKFLPDYFGLVRQYYGGAVRNMDFRGAPDESRIEINNWVEEKTNNKIKDLIPPGLIDSMTRLVLTNAVYFKGDWASKFKEEGTQKEDFYVSSEKIVEVDMMSQKTDDFSYYEDESVQVLEMPYAGEELSMIAILPRGNLDDLANDLNSDNLANWLDGMYRKEVIVHFPRFKFETKYRLSGELASMGMPTAFGAADFSGMTGNRDLQISDVIHQAFVEVNEEGTEAAAATAVVIRFTSLPDSPKEFYANKPFVFLIKDNKNGLILFMGKVVDPTA